MIAKTSDGIEASETVNMFVLADEERQKCEVWTRVMGYHRPVTSFNGGKQEEYADRVCFAGSGDNRA